MPNPTTVTDLEDRWRPLEGQEVINASAFLEDAWALLLSRRPSLEADMGAGTVATANVVHVVSAMVLRVLKNPEGYQDVAIDDFRARRHELVAAGVLTVTDDELTAVTPAAASRRVRSVRLTVYGDA